MSCSKRILITLALCVPPAFADQPEMNNIDCIIEPHIAVELSTAVDGIVAEVLVDRGDAIVTGQELVRLESGVEEAAVKLARARAGEEAEVELAREQMEFALRKQARTNQLFSENAISEFAKDEVDLEVNMSRLQLRQARENRERATLELQRASEVLKLRTIRSPIDGVVVERIASPGEAIGEQKTVLMRLVQVNPLNVELIVPAEYFGSISPGDTLTVKTYGAVEDEFEAEVALIDPVIDGSSDTFGVRALLPNPEYRVPAGLSCFVSLDSLVRKDESLAGL